MSASSAISMLSSAKIDPLKALEAFIRKCVLPSSSQFRFTYFTEDADQLSSDLERLQIPFCRILRFSFLISLTRDRWIEICEYGICGKPAEYVQHFQAQDIGSHVSAYIQGVCDGPVYMFDPILSLEDTLVIDANLVAERILYWATLADNPVDNLKLSRMLYYMQGYHLAKFNSPLFYNEIHAWATGPVVPDVYYCYSWNGSDPIRKSMEPAILPISDERKSLVADTFFALIPYSGKQLAIASRKEAPWQDFCKHGVGLAIPNTALHNYFSQHTILKA